MSLTIFKMKRLFTRWFSKIDEFFGKNCKTIPASWACVYTKRILPETGKRCVCYNICENRSDRLTATWRFCLLGRTPNPENARTVQLRVFEKRFVLQKWQRGKSRFAPIIHFRLSLVIEVPPTYLPEFFDKWPKLFTVYLHLQLEQSLCPRKDPSTTLCEFSGVLPKMFIDYLQLQLREKDEDTKLRLNPLCEFLRVLDTMFTICLHLRSEQPSISWKVPPNPLCEFFGVLLT